MLRDTTEKDLDTIINFIKKLAEYEKMSDEVIIDPKLMKEWLFEKKLCKCKFALDNDKPVGFALYFYNYSTFKGKAGLYLEDLFVYPEYRNKGYGKELFKSLIQEAKENNLGRMEWCCLDWNEPSIRFYKSMNAKAMDEWTTYRLDESQFDSLLK
ncbi:MAG: GNAT family N-acetyltransferase [Bacilli bacterium]